MLPEIILGLAGSLTSSIAYEALQKAMDIYRSKKGLRSDNDSEQIIHKVVPVEGIEAIANGGRITFQFHSDETIISLRNNESPIEASRSTQEIIATQVTILEKERNRLIPIAAREHWVALTFAIIAGIVFFTSIGLFIFATITKGVAVFVAGSVPGFLSKVFFSREAIVEKRLKEISSDLRESEKTKERLEIIEEALKVIPEEHRERVLEDFTKSTSKKLPPAKKTSTPPVSTPSTIPQP